MLARAMPKPAAFRQVDVLRRQPFEAGLLPDQEKERLARALLAEFGVTQVQVTADGEMIHSCPLPFGGHRNGDATASASLNYKKLTFCCLGCGSSGGLLWFIAACRGEDGQAARRWLEDQTGTGAEEQSLVSLLAFFDAVYGEKEAARPAPIPKMSQSVLVPWRKIHPYLTEDRGISPETVMAFQVGYAATYRTRCGESFIESPRIVIPHLWKGDLVGWQTRRLLDDGTAKYISSPDFPKDTTVYHHDPAQTSAVVVESPMSVLVSAEDGPHYEATFGATVTDRQCRILSIHRKVILWMDNDKAGWKATEVLIEALSDACDVWVVDSRWNEDPGGLDRAERMRLLTDCLTPAALWKPPAALRCWGCKTAAHPGDCTDEQEMTWP